MASIVEYRDQVEPVNEYPARIVSPSHPSSCCTDHMETLGEGRIEGLWRYVYKRCRVCGYTVRCFYAMSWVALAGKWAQDCPDLAHWRVRLKRKQAILAQGLPALKRPRGTAFRRSLTTTRAQGGQANPKISPLPTKGGKGEGKGGQDTRRVRATRHPYPLPPGRGRMKGSQAFSVTVR